MFFNLTLLSPQHEARLYFAWIAGTRGVRYVNKKDVVEVDIVKLCQEIQRFVCSQSSSPHARFSLRLSALLTNGTLKLYKQKAVLLYEETIKILTYVAQPQPIQLLFGEKSIFATPPSPVIKKKTKKRRLEDIQDTPESQLARLVQDITQIETPSVEDILFQPEGVLQARRDDITLRESHVTSGLRLEAVLEEGEEFGPPLSEAELMRDITEPRLSQQITPLEQTLAPSIRSRRTLLRQEPLSAVRTSSSEEGIATGPTSFVVEAMVHAPSELPVEIPQVPVEAEPSVQIDQERTLPPRVSREVPVEAEPPLEERTLPPRVTRHEVIEVVMEEEEAPRPVLREIQVDVAEKRVKKKKPPTQKVEIDKNKLVPMPRKTLRIDRNKTDEDLMVQLPILPQFKQKVTSFTELLKEYLVEEGVRPTAEVSVPSVPTLVCTPPPVMLEAALKTPQLGSVTSMEVEGPPPPVGTSTPLETEVPQLLTPSKTKVTQRKLDESAESQLLESPRKRRRLFEAEPAAPRHLDFITLPSEMELTELPSLHPETVESGPVPILTPQQRQQDIVDKLFVTPQLSLEDLCQKPISRLHIARAFDDVLVLCRHNYVTLVSEEDSAALKWVQKGPKMSR